MPNVREQFHTIRNRKTILIAEDELINQEILKNILKDQYGLLFAKDGEETLNLLKENHETIDLLLLDLNMPKIGGIDVLKTIEADDELKKIPVIVMTIEEESEVECLNIGANDFIRKPYNHPEVILARVKRVIELAEDRILISSTERDSLTGLYNQDYFYRYATQFDQRHHEADMDAIVFDVDHFRLINERYGRDVANKVLMALAAELKKMMIKNGGIVSRRVSDTFMAYVPHGMNYEKELLKLSKILHKEFIDILHLRIRMGVYENVDKDVEVESRFSRALLACNKIRNDYRNDIAYYDETAHSKELFNEQLIEDFNKAIEEEQFEVYYQPKFNVQFEKPYLESSEALVRWNHPELGFIPPDSFIPLFEENGLIRELDCYVWDKTAADMNRWRKKYGFAIPVSVNVSRIDIFDLNFNTAINSIMEMYDLDRNDFRLEITESAYTSDTRYVIDRVKKLREDGFLIGMDDFGSGYSSLSMLSELPIDFLKLDKSFVDAMTEANSDSRMLKLIMDLSDYLGTIVVAEGVETKEQLDIVRSMGVEVIQGYYFSKPIKADDYEKYVAERADQIANEIMIPNKKSYSSHVRTNKRSAYLNIAKALSLFYSSIYYVNLETDEFIEYSSRKDHNILQVIQMGDDFFDYCIKRSEEYVYKDDLHIPLSLWNKKNLLNLLEKGKIISRTYRTNFNGVLEYVNVRIIETTEGNNRYLIVGMSDVNENIKQEIHKRVREEN